MAELISSARSKRNYPHTDLNRALGFQEVKAPPEFLGNWWQGCQAYAPAAFTLRRYSWCSFLLEAGTTPKSYGGRKDLVKK